MTKDIKEMTQAEFEKQMAEIKEKHPKLFQFIVDFINRKVTIKEVGDLPQMEQSDQVDYIENYKARA